ncbi:MAG: dockerin type I domain-containing protein [Pirellulales bacterium]|nr:dockerin type I domain-containing protein [Pirellulales bacterium]
MSTSPDAGPQARKKKRRRLQRQLKLQTLEQRHLLAADAGDVQNVDLPEDVNADGAVSSVDALMVINRLRRNGGEQTNSPQRAFPDVNGDGNVTSLDALRVINRMRRHHRGSDRPGHQDPPADGPVDEIQSIDGSGNNLDDPTLGSADTNLRRLVEADYADGISEPAGQDRPSAREISNLVADQPESVLNDRGLSDLIWQWGQFLDHDIDLSLEGDGESLNIAVPTGDEFFDPNSEGDQEILFTRSAVAEGTGIDSPAEQINGITSFIDGSMVYGSSEEVAASLRSFEGGRLLTSENDLLPTDENGFFLAGDVRVNEQSGLTAMHTLWMREHNRIADEISASDPSLSDEEIYQLARRTVIAEIQAITFNEYLPALLGRSAVPRYQGYDSSVDPSISNLFATAIFRFGHTQLSSELMRLDDDGNVIEAGHLALRDAFFNPSPITEEGIDSLLKGLATNVSQEIDTQVIDDVRNFLFGSPGSGGFDLASLNIQRGRDHGLPDYNSVRQQLGLERAETFADITSDPELQAKLEQAYGDVDSIDVWVGALAEDHVRGGSVGELTRTVLLEQFTALRDGDRFWYQNLFRGSELREIERTRLSDVIERNTDLTSIQNHAFFAPGEDPVGDRPGNGRGPRGDRPGGDRPGRDGDRGSRRNSSAPGTDGPVDSPITVGDNADDDTVGDPSLDERLAPPPVRPNQAGPGDRGRRPAFSSPSSFNGGEDDAVNQENDSQENVGLHSENVDRIFGGRLR